jgi:hypothetical protein
MADAVWLAISTRTQRSPVTSGPGTEGGAGGGTVGVGVKVGVGVGVMVGVGVGVGVCVGVCVGVGVGVKVAVGAGAKTFQLESGPTVRRVNAVAERAAAMSTAAPAMSSIQRRFIGTPAAFPAIG